MEEMRQSRPNLSAGYRKYSVRPDSRKVGKVLSRPQASLSLDRAPKGSLALLIVSDGTTQAVSHLRVRPPSFINLQAFRKMAPGALVADVVAIIGTIDIVLGKSTADGPPHSILDCAIRSFRLLPQSSSVAVLPLLAGLHSTSERK